MQSINIIEQSITENKLYMSEYKESVLKKIVNKLKKISKIYNFRKTY